MMKGETNTIATFSIFIIIPLLIISILFCVIIYQDVSKDIKCKTAFGFEFEANSNEPFDNKFNCCKVDTLVNNGVYEKKEVCYGIDLVGGLDNEFRN